MSGDLRYPIGSFQPVLPSTSALREAALGDLAGLPRRMRDAVEGLDDARLDTPYRPGGWTVRQVVHHVADSHIHGFIRVKLTLTEDTPTIKPYDENAWAGLPDARLPIAVSLGILDHVHVRWLALYADLDPSAFERTFVHPEFGETYSLDRHLQLYAWHSRHHVAHITALRVREGW